MIPKQTWPKAPERGSSAELKAEYLETKKRARQAIDDLNAGRVVLSFAKYWWKLWAWSLLIGMIIGWAIRYVN